MADLPPPGKVTCPFCDKVCTVPSDGSADCLPNNVYALHIIKLKDKINQLETAVAQRDITIAQRDNVVAEQGSVIATQRKLLKNGQ